MKKTVKVAVVVLGLAAIFGLGAIFAKASSDWQTTAVNNAYSQLLGTASTTTNEIKSNADTDINKTIDDGITKTVDEQQAELQKLLDQYYQMKLDGLTQTDDFKALETQIAQIRQNVFDAYKKQIDDAFAAQQH